VAVGAEQRAGWGFQILPYIEGTDVQAGGPLVAVGTPSNIFFCPTRRAPQTVVLEDHYAPPLTGATVEHALCDYAASNRELTGIVRRFEPVRLSQVTDGTSQTLLAADKRLNVAQLGEPQDDDNEGYTVGWNEDTIRRTERVPLSDHLGNTDGDGDGEKRFGSSHVEGINAAFADGSVHSIAYDVDRDVFRALGDIAGGESIEITSF
jgi:prepilin-type processing-associated H-X9-DG protein